MWQTLITGADDASLAELLERAFGLTPERARADVAAFLRLLEDRELLDAGA